MKQKNRNSPNKNPRILQTIMFGLVLGMKLKMRVTTNMMSGSQERKAMKMKVLRRMRKKCRKIKITSSKRNFLHINYKRLSKYFLFIYLIFIYAILIFR